MNKVTSNTFSSLLLVGGGAMGQALLTGWQESGMDLSGYAAIDPKEATRQRLHKTWKVQVFDTPSGLPASFVPEAVLFAVKPQSLDIVLPPYRALLEKFRPLVISIVAGKPMAAYESGSLPVVRAMPNTPALLGEGMTVMIANAHVTDEMKKRTETLLRAVGEVAWLPDGQENLMNVVTAISGSGPAYYFYFMEIFSRLGRDLGLPESLAQQLAIQTANGSGQMAHSFASNLDELRRLRQRVTSPGGTTEAAFKILEKEEALADLIEEAVEAAIRRARELE